MRPHVPWFLARRAVWLCLEMRGSASKKCRVLVIRHIDQKGRTTLQSQATTLASENETQHKQRTMQTQHTHTTPFTQPPNQPANQPPYLPPHPHPTHPPHPITCPPPAHTRTQKRGSLSFAPGNVTAADISKAPSTSATCTASGCKLAMGNLEPSTTYTVQRGYCAGCRELPARFTTKQNTFQDVLVDAVSIKESFLFCFLFGEGGCAMSM